METATKVEIHYDAYRYEMSIKQWNKKTELLKSIDHELKKHFPAMKIKIDSLFPYPEVELYKLVEKKYAQNNPMGLSGIKLAELHEIDFRYLLNNQMFEYHKMIDLKKPTKADHTFYAETKDEIHKLEKCQAFIESIKELSGKETFNMSEQHQIRHLTKGSIKAGRNSTIIPNVTYIKDAV